MTDTEPREQRTPDEILTLALTKEAQARDFYANLALDCRVDFVRDLLLRLQAEETRHVKLIKEMQTRMAAGKRIT